MIFRISTILLFAQWLPGVVRCYKPTNIADWKSNIGPGNDDIYIESSRKWLFDKDKQKHNENYDSKIEVFVKDTNIDSKSKSQETVMDQDEPKQELTDKKKKEKVKQSALKLIKSNEMQSSENGAIQEEEKEINVEEINYSVTSSEETQNIKKLLNVADISLGDDKMFIKELKNILNNKRNQKTKHNDNSEYVSYENKIISKKNMTNSNNKVRTSSERYNHIEKDESVAVNKETYTKHKIANEVKETLRENIFDQVQKQVIQNKNNGSNYEILIHKIKNNLTPLIKELIQQERKANVISNTNKKLKEMKSSSYNTGERFEDDLFKMKSVAFPTSAKNSGNVFMKSQANDEVKHVSFDVIDDLKNTNRFEKVIQNSVNEVVTENSYRLYDPSANNMQKLYQNQNLYVSNAGDIQTVQYDEQTQNNYNDYVPSQIEENPTEKNNIGVVLPSIVITEESEYSSTTTEGFVTSKSYGVIHNFFGKIKKKLKKKIDKILGR